MFARQDSREESPEGPEISVYLRPEEWLDLADAMKREYERHDEARKDHEQGRSNGSSEDWS
jgi:hypothetical protein